VIWILCGVLFVLLLALMIFANGNDIWRWLSGKF
jgi:hypothetical protein